MIYILITIGFIVLLLAGLYIRYRLGNSKETTIEGYFVYQFIDLGQDDFIRTTYEGFLNNQRILLLTKVGKQHFFVSKKERKDCWADAAEMLKQGKSKLVQLKTKRLLFGGDAPATILSITISNRAPIKQKS